MGFTLSKWSDQYKYYHQHQRYPYGAWKKQLLNKEATENSVCQRILPWNGEEGGLQTSVNNFKKGKNDCINFQ